MPQTPNSDITILGAGIAGLSTAYHLAVKHNLKNITLVDERAPLGLTSSRGTMAYRNWFPGPGDAMVQLMNRSTDLLQEIDAETNHALRLSQNGYMYFTARPSQIETWRNLARDGAQRGVGEFREHSNAQSYLPSPVPTHSRVNGVDLITDPDTIRQLLPCVTADVAALLHIRRAGAFDALFLGSWLFDQARARGVQFIQDRVEKISTRGNRISTLQLASGAELDTGALVIAAGPLLPNIARLLDLDLPLYNELHAKITIPDPSRVFPRTGDLMLWSDPQYLEWSAQERADFSPPGDSRLTAEFPGGVHFLPKGTADNPTIMGLWTYDIHASDFVPEPVFDPYYAEIVLRGLARMLPDARVYFGSGSRAFVDGGYYCKTRENRPLIGPLPIQGAYIIGALSGFGVMASQGAADLLSAYLAGTTVPPYAKWFLLSRYQDPSYNSLLEYWDSRSGQL